MIDQALEEADSEISAGGETLADKAQRIAYNMIFGKTAADRQKRKEYLERLLIGAPQELKDTFSRSYSTASTNATPPPVGEDTKVLIKKLENNFARMKREMRESDKIMKELTQKLDNHRDKLNDSQQSQSKKTSEC